MTTPTLTTDQIVELVRQLPPQQKRAVLLMLADDAASQRNARLERAEQQLAEQARERGHNWQAMDEDARAAFVDDLLHETP